MHVAACRCGYPTDSSDLAAGTAGAATSAHSLLQCRQDCCGRHSPGWRLGQLMCCEPVALTHTASLHGCRCAAESMPYLHATGQQATHSITANRRDRGTDCAGLCLTPRSSGPLFPPSFTGPLSRAAHSVGSLLPPARFVLGQLLSHRSSTGPGCPQCRL